MNKLLLSGAFLSALAACDGGAYDIRELEDTNAIIGGTTHTGDPAVVALFAHSRNSSTGSLCTATVISPTVLLTAAHCVSPDENPPNAVFEVITSPNFITSLSSQNLSVKETHFDAQFDSNDLDNGHDIGIVVLDEPVSITPRPFLRSPLTQNMIGDDVRIVGYGNNNGAQQSGSGIKRQATTTLQGFDTEVMHIGSSQQQTCSGDSGGPAFMTVNGVEVIVGITSYGNSTCTNGSYDTRVDLYTHYIDSFLQGGTPSTPPPSTGCFEQESNNTTSLADTLCDGAVEGRISSSGDLDYFTWTVPSDSTYYVTLSNLADDFTMRLYKMSGSRLTVIADAENEHDLSVQEIARRTTTGGTYFLRVSGVNGAYDADPYSVNVVIE